MSAEYVADLVKCLESLNMGGEDNLKVAEAFASIDGRETRNCDIDDLGRLLEASGKPLPGKK